jgi:hypothetical protein
MARTALLCALLCLATTSTAEAAKTKRRAKVSHRWTALVRGFRVWLREEVHRDTVGVG